MQNLFQRLKLESSPGHSNDSADSAGQDAAESRSSHGGVFHLITENQSVEALCGAVKGNVNDESDSNSLCSACEDLVSNRSRVAKPSEAKPTEKVELVHHERGGVGLRDAALASCSICLYIWNSLTGDERYRMCAFFAQADKFPGFDAEDFATKYRIVSNEDSYVLEYMCHYGNRVVTPRGDYLSYGTRVERHFVIVPTSGMETKLHVQPIPNPDIWLL
jgi:hypothetical protein